MHVKTGIRQRQETFIEASHAGGGGGYLLF